MGDVTSGKTWASGETATADKLNSMFTGSVLADGTVSTNKIVDLAVTNGKLAANSVTSDKILDGAVGASKLGSSNYATEANVKGIVTTGTVSLGSPTLTVASAAGITTGMSIVAKGVTPGTTVSTVVGTTITMSANAGVALSSDPVEFFEDSLIVTPSNLGGRFASAWFSFTSSGSVTNLKSYNVSSVTYVSTGVYTVNFTTAFGDTSYVPIVNISTSDPGNTGIIASLDNPSARTTSSLTFTSVRISNGATIDAALVNGVVYR